MDIPKPSDLPIDLSIIIVNYNVKHFLEQCLLSVFKACHSISAEVIVIDNNSVDGSQQMLKEKFGSKIILIENKDNPGFSKANNQGISISKGRYVLLLNPDTVVEESTFMKCIEYMDAHPKAGGLGVKMINGEGHFLPESKRSLPTPWVSFYKIFGLSTLFPKNKRFGQYHLSYLDKDQNHEIEILSGAFMWMRKSVLEEVGYLDEDFFMYGEDIDLSYRILLADYTNHYLADTQIIHYKGESTKKGSLNYVKVFYQAMIIFAEKHFGGRKKKLFIAGIKLAVYARALMAVIYRFFTRFGFPLIEAALVYAVIFGIKSYWEHYVKYIEGGAYPITFDVVAAPIYTIVFISFLWLAGAYKKPYRLRPIITATFSGFIAIATVSYLFPDINFSRAIVGLSSIFTMIMAITTRGIHHLRENGTFFFGELTKKRIAIVGNTEEVQRIGGMFLRSLSYPVEIVGGIIRPATTETPHLSSSGTPHIESLGSLAQIEEIIQFYDLEEVIFGNLSIPTEEILNLMQELEQLPQKLSYKIVPPNADYIIGPQSIYSSRHQQAISFNLQKREFRLQKNIFDLIGSLCLLISYPFVFWLYQRPGQALNHILHVLFRQSHLVGYIHTAQKGLPGLKPGWLTMLDRLQRTPQPDMDTNGLDKYYARMYSWYLDLEILLKGWRKL